MGDVPVRIERACNILIVVCRLDEIIDPSGPGWLGVGKLMDMVLVEIAT
jgi:hypothetical protein